MLLALAAREARRRGIHVSVINPKLLSSSQHEIVRQMFPQGGFMKAVGKAGYIGGTVAVAGSSPGFQGTEESLRPSMLDFLAQGPLLLVLDEAHRCGPEGLGMLFDIVQECMWDELPLAVIIAGTPGLVQHLRRNEMTYGERSKFLEFNTLSREEAGEALDVPARKAGRVMGEDALECLLDFSDNHPFFIQVVGEHAWEVAERRGGPTITLEDAKPSLEAAGKRRREFHNGRYQELVDMEIDTYALQAIDLIEGRPSKDIGYKQLVVGIMEANEGMERHRAQQIQKHLLSPGFILDNSEKLEAGIPSLFDYVKEQEEAG